MASFAEWFPELKDIESKVTSREDRKYNCIAWAFKDNRRFWWPNPGRSYWPIDPTRMSAMEAFEAWFEHDGWELTENAEFEAAYEKVALFAKEGTPTHAACLLTSGSWTSKLGRSIDISHGLRELDGPVYGQGHTYLSQAGLTLPNSSGRNHRISAITSDSPETLRVASYAYNLNLL